MKSHLSLFSLVAAIALFGAGCGSEPEKKPEPVSIIGGSASSTENAVSSTAPVVEPVRWDRTSTPGGVDFTSPKGYWVSIIENLRTLYVIPGKAPEAGSEDPRVTEVPKSVATFTELQIDPSSFPTWENFVVTMAQFGCANGTTDEDFVTCTDKKVNVSTGKTEGGLLYEKFSLPAKLQKTGAVRGMKTFIVVRLALDSDNGIMVSVLDEAKASVALELAKSMRIAQ